VDPFPPISRAKNHLLALRAGIETASRISLDRSIESRPPGHWVNGSRNYLFFFGVGVAKKKRL
jgi:hypothetical protein